MSRDDRFLTRWSRRKRKAASEPDAAEHKHEASESPSADAGVDISADRTDEEILADLGLKDPDLLEQGDDFSAFMRAAVPQHIRRRALRRLWRSNPVLANLDGLNDYDTDFTGDSVAPGALKTAYKVGVGLLNESGREAAMPENPEIDSDAGSEPERDQDIASDSGNEPEQDQDIAESVEISEISPESGDSAEDIAEPRLAPRRRMQFRFDS